MSEQNKKNWFKKHPVWSVLIGLFVLFMLIGIFGESPEEEQSDQTVTENNEIIVITESNENTGSTETNSVKEEERPNQTVAETNEIKVVINENIGKSVSLNSCLLDPENADYWQGKEVNFWTSTKREAVAFKLPACNNVELEIVDYANEDGSEFFKIKNDNKEGWISKIQLIK